MSLSSDSNGDGSSGRPTRLRTWVRTFAVLSVVGAGGLLVWASWHYHLTPAHRAGQAAASRGADLTSLFNLDNLQVPSDELLPGGPPKDGIPSLTTADALPEDQRTATLHGPHPPRIVEAAAVDSPDERVVGVAVGDEARAYPIAVLNYHEVVNDVLGGVPIAVIYCPLCDSVSVVDRRVGEEVYEFGISGLLYNSNVLMYDRTDEALWSQIELAAISGPHAGRSLTHLPGWQLSDLASWMEAHPETSLLTYDTGHNRRYQRNPYASYFEVEHLMFPVSRLDDRLDPKARVVGVRLGETSRAYPVEAVRAAGRLEDQLEGGRIVLEWVGDPGGIHVASAPSEAQTIHTFWFAWAASWPGTDVYGPDAEE